MYYLRVNYLQMYIYFRHLLLNGVQLFSGTPLWRHLPGLKRPVKGAAKRTILHIVRRVIPDYPVYLLRFRYVQAVAERRARFVFVRPTVVPVSNYRPALFAVRVGSVLVVFSVTLRVITCVPHG